MYCTIHWDVFHYPVGIPHCDCISIWNRHNFIRFELQLVTGMWPVPTDTCWRKFLACSPQSKRNSINNLLYITYNTISCLFFIQMKTESESQSSPIHAVYRWSYHRVLVHFRDTSFSSKATVNICFLRLASILLSFKHSLGDMTLTYFARSHVDWVTTWGINKKWFQQIQHIAHHSKETFLSPSSEWPGDLFKSMWNRLGVVKSVTKAIALFVVTSHRIIVNRSVQYTYEMPMHMASSHVNWTVHKIPLRHKIIVKTYHTQTISQNLRRFIPQSPLELFAEKLISIWNKIYYHLPYSSVWFRCESWCQTHVVLRSIWPQQLSISWTTSSNFHLSDLNKKKHTHYKCVPRKCIYLTTQEYHRAYERILYGGHGLCLLDCPCVEVCVLRFVCEFQRMSF